MSVLGMGISGWTGRRSERTDRRTSGKKGRFRKDSTWTTCAGPLPVCGLPTWKPLRTRRTSAGVWRRPIARAGSPCQIPSKRNAQKGINMTNPTHTWIREDAEGVGRVSADNREIPACQRVDMGKGPPYGGPFLVCPISGFCASPARRPCGSPPPEPASST